MARSYEQLVQYFGNQVRNYRKAANLTGTQLAELITERTGLTMDQGGVSRVENGNYNLSLKAVVSFAEVLGIEPETLLGFPESKETLRFFFDEALLRTKLQKLSNRFGWKEMRDYLIRDLSRLETLIENEPQIGFEAAEPDP